jgi:hypothetical protein
MTKDEVLSEVARSPEQFGVRRPSPEMISEDLWQMTCGTGTGAAPGYAAVRITFHQDKVIKIEIYTGQQPA